MRVKIPVVSRCRITKTFLFFFSAGGQAIDSKMRRMLDVVPEDIHDKAGIFLGSHDEVEKVKAFHK